MKKFIALFLLLSLSTFAQSKFTTPIIPPSGTVSQLPTASSWTYGIFEVTDGTSSTDCTSGSGSTKVLCQSNGTTWAAIGGSSGSSAYTYFSGQQTAVSQTGSNVALYTISSVPALSAGKCYYVEAGFTVSNSANVVAWTVYVDGTQIYAPYSGASVGNARIKFLYCNVSGQTTQQMVAGEFNYNGSNGPNDIPWQSVYGAWISTPTSVNWASSHTIYFYSNSSTGTITPNYVRISQE